MIKFEDKKAEIGKECWVCNEKGEMWFGKLNYVSYGVHEVDNIVSRTYMVEAADGESYIGYHIFDTEEECKNYVSDIIKWHD